MPSEAASKLEIGNLSTWNFVHVPAGTYFISINVQVLAKVLQSPVFYTLLSKEGIYGL